MKKLFIYAVFFLVVAVSCDKYDISPKQSETFIKYYGGSSLDHGNDVKQLPNGGYFVVGTISAGENNTDVFLLITDKFGNSETDVKTFGGPFNDKISMMQLLPDGGAVAIGTYQQTQTPNNSDIWVIRFDYKGDTLWTRTFGTIYSDEGSGLLVNTADEIVCTGYTTIQRGANVFDKQIWMYALFLDGTNAWLKERDHGPAKDDEGIYLVEVDDGYVVIGTTKSYPSGTTSKNILLLKTDKNGINPLLIKTIGGDDDDYGKMVKTFPDGNLLIVGTTTNISTGSSDILLTKIDASFNELWTLKQLDDGENETASSVIFHNNQVLILGTTFEPRTDTKKMLLITTDNTGENPTFYKYGFTKEKIEGYGLDYTSDGGYILTGSNILLFKIKDLAE